MYEVDTVSPYRLLAEARSSIGPPYIGEADARGRAACERLGAETLLLQGSAASGGSALEPDRESQ